MERPTSHFEENDCPILCITKSVLFLLISAFVLYLPFGDTNVATELPHTPLPHQRTNPTICCICHIYNFFNIVSERISEVIDVLAGVLKDALYDAKLKFYSLLETVDRNDVCSIMQCCAKDNSENENNVVIQPRERSCRCHKKKKCAIEEAKEAVDKVIEDEITGRLSEDFLQSLERKFQVDLQKSIDSVLLKIKLLLKNGTLHIQDKLTELQDVIEVIKSHGEAQLDTCLMDKQDETTELAEKALHQMIVCGYALIGHDPGQALQTVAALKEMIRRGLKPVYDQKTEVYGLLKACGHDHGTLKQVIKCVISKSPVIKSAMMDITRKLIDGVVGLTKLMAHGAMHEACLIEVIRQIEDEAFTLVEDVKTCVYKNSTATDEVENYIKNNNATVLDLANKRAEKKKNETQKMKEMLRRMLEGSKVDELDQEFKNKLKKLQENLAFNNEIGKKTNKDAK